MYYEIEYIEIIRFKVSTEDIIKRKRKKNDFFR